ncbi:hypothetical protein ECZU12_25310 [Escherichia coli]|nr:hypothetical protein ECZU12_25310 [Escherichia coli]
MNDKQKPADKTPWRHDKTPEQNRKRIIRLVELWPESFNQKTKPLKVGIPDDLIQDIAIRELAFGAGTLHAAVASQSPRYYRALIAGGAVTT